MNPDLRVALIKFFIIVALTLIYVGLMALLVGPYIQQVAFAQQSAFDNTNPYGNQYDQQQYQQPYGQQQYQQPYQQYDQYQQQPYQQYGTQQYGMQPQYGVPQQQYGSNTVLGFGVQEIVTALIAGGGATAYARRRSNSLEADKQLIMAEMLKDKQRLAELARVSYDKMPKKGFEISDAPSIKLDTINENIENFADKTAQA